MLLNKIGFPVIAFNAEGGAGGAGDPPAVVPPVEPESVLFPKEGETIPPAGEKQPDPVEGDWKEYAPDPAKSDEENAAAKAEHDKTKPAGDDKDKTADADKVPDDGKYELAMPDGIEVDAELLAAVSPRFKELGLTRAQAQALTDDFIKVQQERGEGQVKAWGERVQKWADDAKADKEIGGDKWTGTVSDAQRAINKLGTPALKEYLNASGGGNHPELIRILAKAGALLKEDNPPTDGGQGSGKPAETAHLLFPNDAPKG